MLLFTFMIAAGALTGEAFYGVEAAVLAVLDEQSIGAQSWWPAGRLIGFLLLNVILGFIIYLLFRSAGIIGVGSEDEGDDGGDSGGSGGSGGGGGASTAIDAELAD
jgi:uncharacterized membrane protein YgcG